MDVWIGSTGMVRLPPIHGGAVESYVCDLALINEKLGNRVTLVSGVRGRSLRERYSIVNVNSPFDRFPLEAPVSAVAHLLGGTATARAFIRETRRPRSQGPDLVHLNEEVSAAILVRRLPDTPKLFTIHNPPPEAGSPTSGLTEPMLRAMGNFLAMRFVIRHVEGVIALSSHIREYLIKNWSIEPSKIACLPLPIDSELYHPSARRNDGTRLLFVGRLDHRKNVPLLVDAVSSLSKEVSLTIVGDGPLRSQLASKVNRIGLAGRVHMLSKVPVEGLISVYQDNDILVLPSRVEAYPRVVVEAASCGMPAVLPEAPPYTDFVSGGFVRQYSPSRPRGLIEALVELHEDSPMRARLGTKARQFVLNNNSYPAFASRLGQLYKSTAS